MKKILLRLISLALICVMLCPLFVACNDDKDDDGSKKDDAQDSDDSGSEDASEEESEEQLKMDETKFNIFFDTDYVCQFVLPKNASSIEKKVATLLKTSVQKKTGKNITIIYEGDEALDDTKPLILVGNTTFTESKTLAKTLADRSSAIKITKNKMAIVFNNESSGLKIVQKLMTQLNKCDKKAVNIKPTWTAKYTSLPEKDAFIKYTGGTVQETDYGNGTVLYTSYGNTVNAYNDYCDSLASAGFEKSENRTIGNNTFTAFIGENEYIYIYYVKNSLTKDYTKGSNSYTHKTNNVSGIVKIARGPIEAYAAADMTSNLKAKYTPKLANIANPEGGDLADVGQGYVFLLPDGRLIVQDGGLVSSANKDLVYESISAVAPDPKNVVIAAWFISHPHLDHQGGFVNFIERHYGDKKITVERVIYNYTKTELYDTIRYDVGFTNGAPTMEECSYIASDFYKKVAKYLPDVPLIAAHTGQIFDFGNDVNVEVLFTVEDIVPDEMENVNNASMVIRVNVKGQSTLLLADTAHKSNPMLKTMWGNHLKSDIVQIGHHGIWTADDDIYSVIGAKVLLWPATYRVAKDSLTQASYKNIVKKPFDLASDVYVSDCTVRVIELPYAIKNNKSAENAKINAAVI